MASARPNVLPNFILTPQQQNLLFRALTSNQPNNNNQNDQESMTPDSLATSPVQNQQSIGMNIAHGLSESPFLDYDYDVGPDSSFDFDFGNDGQTDGLTGRMIGDLPGSSSDGSDGGKDDSKTSSPDNESSDKRSHPDEDDDDEAENGAKRRESDGKVPKKPGRKPLTNEPSSVSEKSMLSTSHPPLTTHIEEKGSESRGPTSIPRAEGTAFERPRDES
jgi:AP-1-like factor